MTEQQNVLTPTINAEGKYTITVTQEEFVEICYALEVLRKKREASRICQRKKYEKEAAGKLAKGEGERRQYRKALNLVIINPNKQ